MARRPASRIRVQNGSDFQIWTTIDSDSASVGSFSQFGPSSPVSLKISWLITPHSGLSMKRTEMMVGIDGTAQGSTNSTARTFTHQRLWVKKPGQEQRDHHLHVDRHDQEHQRVDRRAQEDRIVDQLDIELRIARQPEGIAHREDDEGHEDREIGRDEQQAPGLLLARGRSRAPGRGDVSPAESIAVVVTVLRLKECVIPT